MDRGREERERKREREMRTRERVVMGVVGTSGIPSPLSGHIKKKKQHFFSSAHISVTGVVIFLSRLCPSRPRARREDKTKSDVQLEKKGTRERERNLPSLQILFVPRPCFFVFCLIQHFGL